MNIEEIRSAKYLVIRPNPQTGLLEAIPFNTKMEVEGFINGSSNPAVCVPVMNLDLEYRLKCKKLK